MENRIFIAKEERNRTGYHKFYGKNPKDSYDIYKKTQVIIKSLKKLSINLQNKNILDIGFGTGTTLLNLPKNKCNLYGTEFVIEACFNLKFKIRNDKTPINLILSSIVKIPFKDNTFDIIICSHVLEHIKEDYLAIMEIWRILTEGGILIFLTPNENYGNSNISHFRNYSHKDLKKLVKNRFSIKFRLKYRTFIDNYLYRIPPKLKNINQILDKLIFLDLLFASKFKNLEDMYLLIKNS